MPHAKELVCDVRGALQQAPVEPFLNLPGQGRNTLDHEDA
jgi:hypothetical protein